MRWITVFTAFAMVSAGCGGQEAAQEEAETQTGPDSAAIAMDAYDPAAFDTVTWDSQQAALERGQVVYQFSCRKCHGEEGLGDAGFVRGGDTLRPPSFQAEDWTYAGDKEGVRQQVFVGTAEDMPHWGLVGLPPRDIDAVAIYILEGLRAEEGN